MPHLSGDRLIPERSLHFEWVSWDLTHVGPTKSLTFSPGDRAGLPCFYCQRKYLGRLDRSDVTLLSSGIQVNRTFSGSKAVELPIQNRPQGFFPFLSARKRQDFGPNCLGRLSAAKLGGSCFRLITKRAGKTHTKKAGSIWIANRPSLGRGLS